MFQRRTTEYIPQHQIRHDIKYRADGTDTDHEPAQVRGIPFAGFPQVFRIHPVERNCGLRNIVQQILDEQMDGQHGQERQEGTGRHHAEHVSEIGAGRHLDVLDDVPERLPSFQYTVFQHHEVLLQQNDVRTFLGNVYRRIY